MKLPCTPKYAEAIRQLAVKAQAWMKANPGKNAKIQFNVPPTVGLTMVFEEAEQMKFIVVNDEGRELYAAMIAGLELPRQEPTVNMVRIALDAITSNPNTTL